MVLNSRIIIFTVELCRIFGIHKIPILTLMVQKTSGIICERVIVGTVKSQLEKEIDLDYAIYNYVTICQRVKKNISFTSKSITFSHDRQYSNALT